MTTYLGDNVIHHQPFNPIWDLSKLFWSIEDIHLRQEESYNQKKKIKNSNFSFALLLLHHPHLSTTLYLV